MAPLRVGAMESFFGTKKEEINRYSASAAAVRAREREATAPEDTESEQDNLRGLTSSAVDQPDAVIAGNRRQQDQISRASGGSSSLENLDPITQARLANIERVRSQASALVQNAKTINPDFVDIIDQWHQGNLDTRATIINTQILAPGAPEEELPQRNKIATLLQRAAQMEESIVQMEQVGIDATSSIAETIAPANIVQVPSPRIRAEQALQALQRENEVHQEALDHLIRLIRASKTMVCLKALDFFTLPMSPITSAFMSANQGVNWETTALTLNNSERPVRLIIPAFEGQSNYTSVVPMIILAGTKTTVNGVTMTAPRRIPTAEENRQVRKLIVEALQAYYGPRVSELFPDLDRVDTPLMVRKISEIVAEIEEYPDNENQNGTATAEAPQIPASLGDAEKLMLNTSDIDKLQEAKEHFDTAREIPSKTLAQAAWYAGETVARGAGVVGGTIAGVSKEAATGALIGAACATAGALYSHGGAGALVPLEAFAFGVTLSNIFGTIGNLEETESNRAVIGSSIAALAAVPFIPHATLLATVATMGGFGAVGGAISLAGPSAPAAAERAVNY